MKSPHAFTRPIGRLAIDPGVVEECRSLAAEIGRPVDGLARSHTSVSIERATLRLIGVDGVDGEGIEAAPIPNLCVERIAASTGLDRGVLIPFLDAVESGCGDIATAARQLSTGEVTAKWPDGFELEIAMERARREAEDAVAAIARAKADRESAIADVGEAPKPWFYLIVATGNIHEDIPQAVSAAREGADVIAVIRSTGQSLLDHVPYGATEDGFAGTYATQENFRLMRAALDEVGKEVGRYIRLTNYASGLCMPEIAALAAMERLDMMLNDCMYGIIFRDINMKRTFVDQRFSRMIHALAGIVINTGEDNYLTTSDAVSSAHSVLASHFLNEFFAHAAGIPDEQLGLGHAFEIDPEVEDQLMLELAHAQLIREVFPNAPLKYMPPTKHMTGDIFTGYLLDGMFNLVGATTGQDIMLLGMLTEGVHTPFLSDRDLALTNARYVFRGATGLGTEISFAPGGKLEERARTVLDETRRMLEKVAGMGLFAAIEAGMFADTSRTEKSGKGLDGVVEKDGGYVNPIVDALEGRLGVTA